DEGTVSQLAAKIIAGGTGVWGEQAMTAHPALTQIDAEEMVKYILSLADSNNGTSGENLASGFNVEPDSIANNRLLQGAIVSVYDLPGNPVSASILPLCSKPKFAGVLSALQNVSGNDFRDLTDNFGLVATGFI